MTYNTTDIDSLRYEPVSPKYRNVQMAGAAIAYLLIGALALLLLLVGTPWWCVGAECVTGAACAVNMAILKTAYRHKGYALRPHDITWRSGVIFPKATTVPYFRIQQVSVSQNPVSRYFGLCSLTVVNGAQGLSEITISGLPKDKAESIKQRITDIITGHD